MPATPVEGLGITVPCVSLTGPLSVSAYPAGRLLPDPGWQGRVTLPQQGLPQRLGTEHGCHGEAAATGLPSMPGGFLHGSRPNGNGLGSLSTVSPWTRPTPGQAWEMPRDRPGK